MRSRPNAVPRRAEVSNGNGVTKQNVSEVVDSNGKDKPKFKRPPKAFALPPPPKLSSLRNGTPLPKSDKSMSNVNASAIDTNISPRRPALPPPPAPTVSIPSPPPSTSAAYQRPNRKSQSSNMGDASITSAASVTSPSNNMVVAPQTSISSDSYSNSYPVRPANQNPQISHPYKPSSWYADVRKIRKGNKILKAISGAVMAIFLIVLLWWGYQQYMISLQNVGTKQHHKRYHHHDVHQVFHPMMGIDESPLGFASAPRREKRSYRQMEQEGHNSHKDKTPEQYDQLSHARTNVFEQTSTHDIFSTFPVKTLSNERLIPYVGFGVTSRSVEHKQIPIIVSTLLQYASSETEGGGGIALIDAVIDEDRKLQNDGGSLQYSISNQVVERYEEEEEKLESSMAKTAVALVGRAIAFFGKEKNKGSSILQKAASVSKESGENYDYENRLEVHLVVGLAGPDLGVDNTVIALQRLVAELNGLVPSFPKDVLNADESEWKMQPSSLTLVDRQVDVRLHVLLRLNHCHDKSHSVKVAPCSSDEVRNKEHLDQFIGSYTVLEKLYNQNIIHGMGLDGMHGQDVDYLVERCAVKPQLYRGDISQALDILRRSHRQEKDDRIATVLKAQNVTFLASNVAGHILERKPMAPNAYALLQNLGGVLYRTHHEMLNTKSAGDLSFISTAGQNGEGQYYTVPRIVLSYLVRHKICVLPHAYKAVHLADDAPEWVGGLANFLTERRVAEIGTALRALLSEEDLPEEHGLGMEGENEVAAVFHNLSVNEVQVHKENENEDSIVSSGSIQGGASIVIIANTGDKFGAYGQDGQKLGDYTVTAREGGADDFTIFSVL